MVTGQEKRHWRAGPIWLAALAFSPDGKVLAGSSRHLGGNIVRLWDTETGRELCRYSGHPSLVSGIAFSPDGKLVASGDLGTRDNSVRVWEAATGRLIRRFEGHHSGVQSVAFSPDGLIVASGGRDSTILLWDITGRQKNGKLPSLALTPRKLDACWIGLADEDAAKAYDAVWILASAPEQSVPFLQRQLPPVPHTDAAILARLIEELDSTEFKVRERATEQLRKLDKVAVPALQKTLDGRPSAEVRKRIQTLVEQPHAWTPERLREHRALQALEHMDSKKGRGVLEALADGAPGAQRTEEAKAALQRLKVLDKSRRDKPPSKE
jgi:hypothetical protein